MGRTHDVVISGFDLNKLERDLNEMTLRWERANDALFAERALADRLGNALEKIPWTFAGREEQASEEWNALTAWKEARND